MKIEVDGESEVARRISVAREADLLRMSLFYDLENPSERLRSAIDLASLFFSLCEIVKPHLFIEAGAFSADAAREYKKRNKSCRVVAFEANPHAHKFWSERYNYGNEGVEYIHTALSDGDETVTMQIPISHGDKKLSLVTGRSSILDRTDAGWGVEQVTVPATTLNQFFTDMTGNNVIWMDVEGAARQVLEGATNVLKQTDMILIEVEEVPYWKDQWLVRDVISFLENFGLYLLARDFESPSRRQYNLLFCQSTILENHFIKTRILAYYNRIAHKRTKAPFAMQTVSDGASASGK